MDIEVESFEVLDRYDHSHLGPVSLRLEAGSRWALMGSTGSGKSLFLRSLAGLHPPGWKIRGSLRLGGCPWPTPSTPKVVLLPQDPMEALNPWLTLGEHLELLPRAWKRMDALGRGRSLAERLGIGDRDGLWERRPEGLSGGQRQRLLMAMLLSCGPEWVLLDEPTAALDGERVAAFGAMLEELRANLGLGWIWATHQPALALRHADWILGLEAGKAVQVSRRAEAEAQDGLFQRFSRAATWD